MIANPYLNDTNPICMQYGHLSNKNKVEWHRTKVAMCNFDLLSITVIKMDK